MTPYLFFAAGTVLGGAIVYVIVAQRASSLAARLAALTERSSHFESQLAAERATVEKLQGSFKLAAQEAVDHVAEKFLTTAVRDLRQVNTEAGSKIAQDKKEISVSVAEMKSKLQEYQEKVDKFENERAALYAKLDQSLTQVLHAEQNMTAETMSLKRVLTASSGVRGSWGERVLREILEQSDFVLGVDFDMQVVSSGENENDGRPDFVIKLPGGRRLVVDSKEVSAEYALAQSTDDPQRQKEHYEKLVSNIRSNFIRLSRKEYQVALDPSVPFVVMFIPSEAAIRAAFATDPLIFQEAADRKVVLASPMTIIPLIYLIRQSWQQHQLASNARELGGVVEELGNRLSTFVGHIVGMRDGIEKSAEAWDRAVGSWERMVSPQLDKVRQLGGKLKETKEILPVTAKLRAPSISLEKPHSDPRS